MENVYNEIRLKSKTSYIRGSGKGGQKINKTNSRAQICFNIFDLEIDNEIKVKLINYFGQNNITIQDQSGRVRESNMDSAWLKISNKIEKALFIKKQRNTEIPQKKAKKIKAIRLKNKKIKANKKKIRRFKRESSDFHFLY